MNDRYEEVLDEPIENNAHDQSDQKEESWPGYAARTGGRLLVRTAESAAGFPGDIANTALGLTNYGISKATGKQSPLPGEIPIGSKHIRENVTKKLTGEYLEPQTENEKFYDEVFEDAATLLNPSKILKGKIPFKSAIVKALSKSALANTTKWASEELTGSKGIGQGVKIGTMILSGMPNTRKQLLKLKDKSYPEAYSNIPHNAQINLSKESRQIEGLIEKLKKGDNPAKKYLIDRFESIRNNVSPIVKNEQINTGILNASGKPIKRNIVGKAGGMATPKDIIDLKQDWNKHLLDPREKLDKGAKDFLKQGVGILNSAIEKFGARHPKFNKPYKVGEELTEALNTSSRLQKILSESKLIQGTVHNPIIKHLLYAGGIGAASHIGLPQGAALIGGTLGAYQGAKSIHLFSKSPEARKYYKEAISAALKNDAGTTAKYLGKLDHIADRFEEVEE